MVRHSFLVLLSIVSAACAAGTSVGAQPLPPMPVQACTNTYVTGKIGGVWESRRDAHHSGRIELTIDLGCSSAASGVQVRNLEIHARDLADNDPGIGRVIAAASVEQLASIGPAMAPTVFVAGSCQGGGPAGCRFWLMLVDNGSDRAKAPDLVAFLVTDGADRRLAYGAGPISEGDILITGAR